MNPRATIHLVLAVLVSGALWGCQREHDPSLERYASCTELDRGVKDLAMRQANWTGGPIGRDWGCINCDVTVAMEGDMAGGVDGWGFSTTNVQEIGVDEADFVKNDGAYLYMVSGEDLVVVQAVPADAMTELSRVTLEGHAGRLYLDGDQLVAITELWGETAVPESQQEFPLRGQLVKLTWVDVSDRAAPSVTREMYIEGSLNTTRLVDDRIYLVTEQWLHGPESVEGPVSIGGMIGESTLADWLPRRVNHQRVGQSWDSTSEPAAACDAVYAPSNPAGTVMTNITTVALNDATAPADSIGVLAPADVVYMSTEHLYLGVKEPDWGPFGDRNNQLTTRIHRFDIQGGPTAPPYEASGEVNGHVLDSFSMGEWDGSLRVATTIFTNGGQDNSVFVLTDAVDIEDGNTEEAGSMIVVGAAEGFGADELITSARFHEDEGYVSTFEQIDPLFTFDLSDPTAPTIMGELEMPGSNTYLQKLGPDHLIGVGQAGTMEGLTGGIQVSLFDVSDLRTPTQVDHEDIDNNNWVESDGLWDHHAITYYPALGTLSIPVVSWDGWGVDRSVLRVYHPSAEGLGFLGEIDHSDFRVEGDNYGNNYCSQVRRSVYIGDKVYAISSLGVQAAPVADLATVAGSYRFAEASECLDNIEDSWAW